MRRPTTGLTELALLSSWLTPRAQDFMPRILRNQFIATLIALTTIAASLFLGTALQQPAFGWVLAALALAAFWYLLRLAPMQAAMIGILYVLALVSWSAPQPWGFVVAPIGVTFGVFVGAIAISDLFVGTDVGPLGYIIRSYLGLLFPPQVVDAPRNAMADGDTKLVGPRLVTVNPEVAVLLLGTSQSARIRGPGRFESQRFEYVARVFNLRPMRRNYRIRDVLTSDTTPVTVEVSIIYGINVREDVRLWAARLGPQDIENLRRLIASSVDWETTLRDVVDRNLRRAIGSRSLAQALNVTIQQDIGEDAARLTDTDINSWGVRIYEMLVVSIQPDSSVVQASMQNWLVGVTNDTLLSKEQARGDAWAIALDSVTQAYQRATNSTNVPDALIYREMVRRLFEQASLDPSLRSLIQSELGQMMTRRDVDS